MTITFAPAVADSIDSLRVHSNIVVSINRRIARDWRADAATAAAHGDHRTAARYRRHAQAADRREARGYALTNKWERQANTEIRRAAARDRVWARYLGHGTHLLFG